MNKEKWFAIGAAIVIPLLMLVAFNALVVQPAIGEVGAEGRGAGGAIQPAQTFKGVVATNYIDDNGTLAVDGAATLNGGFTVDTTAFSVADASGNTSIAGTLGVTGDATFSAGIIRSGASITPTDGGVLTPTAEIMTLTPGGALGTAMGACTTGKSVVLYNSVNANVVITDTGNFIGAGNQTLGQYDTLRLVCIDSKWVQVGAVSAN